MYSIPKGTMLGVFYDNVEGSASVCTGTQQFNHVGVVDLLQEFILTHQVL